MKSDGNYNICRCNSQQKPSIERTIKGALFQITFRCEIDKVDFTGDVSKIEREVDEWAARTTEEKMRSFSLGNGIKPSDTLFILSVAYFNGARSPKGRAEPT